MTGGTAEVSAQAAGATSANSAVDKDEDKEKGVVSPRMRVLAGHMHAFNAFVAAEPRLQVVMLPLRDGLSVIRYQQQRQRQQQAPSASSDGGLR